MDRLVALAVSRRYLMVAMFVAVLVGGLIAFKQLNIEAYPDPTPPMVDIVTQSPGLSSEEIERYITIPIETQVSGIKNLRTMRTISPLGRAIWRAMLSPDIEDTGKPRKMIPTVSLVRAASRVSTHREAVTRELNRLSRIGIAERQDSALLVKDLERLADMVHEARGE